MMDFTQLPPCLERRKLVAKSPLKHGVAPDRYGEAETVRAPGSVADASVLGRLGLDPLAAAAVVSVDLMLFGGEASTLGIGWLVSIPVAILVAGASLLLQRFRYGDGWVQACAKALLLATLTAIPTPLPSAVTAALGGAGMISRRRLPSRNR